MDILIRSRDMCGQTLQLLEIAANFASYSSFQIFLFLIA